MAKKVCEKCGLRIMQFASMSEVRRASFGVDLCSCPGVHTEAERQIILRFKEIKSGGKK